MAKRRKKAKKKAKKTRTRTRTVTKWRTRSARKKPRRRRRLAGKFTTVAKKAIAPAAALGVSAVVMSGFGNRLLSGMFKTPTTRALGKAGVALATGLALWQLKQKKAAGVVMTAGVAASVMEITGAMAGPQIDSIMARVPSLQGLRGGAAAPAAAVSGVGARYPVARREDTVFARPF